MKAGMNQESNEMSKATSLRLNLAALNGKSSQSTPAQEDSTARLDYRQSLKQNLNELEPGFYQIQDTPRRVEEEQDRSQI